MGQHSRRATVSATMLQREVGSVLRRVGQEKQHIIVERAGFPVVAIIPIVEYGLWMQQQTKD